jgi:electron transport complex protein RnfB
METAIIVLVVMTIVGLIFGLVLAFANKKFAMEVNPLIELVEDILPKGQCGSCGYAGCKAYAEAVVSNPDVPPNLCTPGKEPVAKAVAELTGKAAEEMEPVIAHIKCSGSIDKAVKSYNYEGVHDCVAASLLQGGPKACKNGCLGFGTCVGNCPFGAMTMGKNGLPIVDKKKCTGCGKCASVCPKKVIEMLPTSTHVCVNCNSKDKGAVVRKVCTVGCLGCGLCKRNCPHEAIVVENNLAIVDTHICMEKCDNPTCIAKCPTKAIISKVGDVKPEVQTKQEIAANTENSTTSDNDKDKSAN